MCGISGIASFTNRYSNEHRHNLVHLMNETIIHRGPDSEGIYDGDWLTIGMRRLSIIDISNGNQPIYSRNGSIVLVFNGEIYNYIELRKGLVDKGYKFKTDSDTEVIANLFEEYNVSSFAMLDGMFAIALYDKNDRQLYLVRDRMGEKPIYYSSCKENIIFGSELKCLLETGMIVKDINLSAMNFFFQYTYIPAPLSIFKDVYKLLPGHFLSISEKGEIKDKAYWQLKKNKEYEKMSYEEAKDELFRRACETVKTRMRSDVPFGAFLSGGVDSGTIVALMAQNSDKQIKTYTIGLKTADDESRRAKRMAEHIGTEHTTFFLDYKDSISIVNNILDHMDEPFADSSCIPEYIVSKLASDYVKVVLTGDAGDEILLGYNKYLINHYVDQYNRIPSVFRRKVIEPTFARIPDKSYLSMKIGKVIRSSNEDIFHRRNRMMQLGFKDEEISLLINEEFVDSSAQNAISLLYTNAPGTDIEKTQYVDLHIVLEGDMLAKVDRMSMLNSIETRTPLLGNDLVEFAYSLPAEYKIHGKTTKRIMKDTFSKLFPVNYEKLPKGGFGVPIDEWMRNDMLEELRDLTSERTIREQGILNNDYIQHVIEEHIKGIINRKSELWSIYIFQKWYNKVMCLT